MSAMESPANACALPLTPESRGGFGFDSLFNTYCQCLGLILLVSAILKAVSSFGTAPILQLPDPIFGLDNRWVFLLTAAIEAVIGLMAVSRYPSARTKSILLTWLGGCFGCYHVGLKLGGIKAPCPCFGRATEWWPWLALHGALITQVIALLLCSTGVIWFLRLRSLSKALVVVAVLTVTTNTVDAAPRVEQFVAHLRTLIETNAGVAVAWRVELPSTTVSPVQTDGQGMLVPTGQLSEQPVSYGVLGGKDYLFLTKSGDFDEALFTNKLDSAFLFQGGRWGGESMHYSPQPGATNAIALGNSGGERGQDEEAILGVKCLGMFNPIVESLKWKATSVEGDMSLNGDTSQPVIRPFRTIFIENDSVIEAHVTLLEPREIFTLRYSFNGTDEFPISWQVHWGLKQEEIQLLYVMHLLYYQNMPGEAASKIANIKPRLDWKKVTVLRFKNGGVEAVTGERKTFSKLQQPGQKSQKREWVKWAVIATLVSATFGSVWLVRFRGSATNKNI